MRKDLITKGKSLTGTSDLTLLAPLKPGFVSSLDAITYKSRAIRLMKTLHGGRVSLHEYALQRPVSDAVERVAKIHSFRVAVLEPENKVLLAVTFDGTWEAYIRVLWHKVGTLLDIIFCNTEGYVLSHSAGFDAWADWVRRVQVETGFYYNTHGVTVEDAHYLRGYEALARRARPSPGVSLGAAAEPADDTALQLLRHHLETPEDLAWRIAHGQPTLQAMAETLRQGLQSLSVLFRLTDTYLPGTTDGDVLKRAARDLLVEFTAWVDGDQVPAPIRTAMERRFKRQLDWLKSPDADLSHPPHAVPGEPQPPTAALRANVQAGILTGHQGMTHGCLLLLAVTDPLAGARLLDELRLQMATESAPNAPGALATNLAITYEGLRALGLSEAQLALFPQEFREGMEARASMLGDFRTNHPRRWRLPQANWHPVAPGRSALVELHTVHLVVQLRIGAPGAVHELGDPLHPLRPAVQAIAGAPGLPRAGIQLLHVQTMRPHVNADNQVREHFGFVDGASDPSFPAAAQSAGAAYDNRLPVGEVIIGQPTQADQPLPPATPAEKERLEWLGDGSFLVVRKLAQAVDVLERTVAQAAVQTGLTPELIKAKMMGRWADGTPLTPVPLPPGANDFNYLAAPTRACSPRQAARPRGRVRGQRESCGAACPMARCSTPQPAARRQKPTMKSAA
jgi:deferrochelatase/peroxidase EfeB